MKLQSRMVLCLLSAMSAHGFGQESAEQEPGSIADVESQFLFINMLEFLGEFETENGEWINPEILGNDVFSDLDNDRDRETETFREQGVLSVTDDE